MGDMLLSPKKAGRFENMIEEHILEMFGEDVDVFVQTNGKVFIRKAGSDVQTAQCVVESEEKVYSVLSDIDFSFRGSSYVLTDGSESGRKGASFYLSRDGW